MKLLKTKTKWIIRTCLLSGRYIKKIKDHKEAIYIVELNEEEYRKIKELE